MKPAHVVFGVTTLLFAQGLSAQDPKDPRVILQAVNRSAAGPASAVASTSQVTIQAAQTDAMALIVLTSGQSKLELSTPLNKDAKQTDFVDLDGLTSGIAGSFTRSVVFGALRLRPDHQSRMEALCRSYGLNLESVSCTDGALEDHLERIRATSTEIERALKAFHNEAFKDASIEGATLTLKAGYKDFNYFTETGEPQTEDRVGASLSAVLYRIGGQQRVSLSVTAERAYGDQKTKAQVCTPVPGSTTLNTCETRPVGEPVQKNEVILRAELRRLDRSAGIAPIVSWRPTSKVLGVDLPVYLVSDDAGRLTGGVRLGFRTDDKFRIAVFVTKPLGLN